MPSKFKKICCCLSSNSDEITDDDNMKRKHQNDSTEEKDKKEYDSGGVVKNKLFAKRRKTKSQDKANYVEDPSVPGGKYTATGQGSYPVVQQDEKIVAKKDASQTRNDVPMETDNVRHVRERVADLTLEPSPPSHLEMRALNSKHQASVHIRYETSDVAAQHQHKSQVSLQKNQSNDDIAKKRTPVGNNEATLTKESQNDKFGSTGPEIMVHQRGVLTSVTPVVSNVSSLLSSNLTKREEVTPKQAVEDKSLEIDRNKNSKTNSISDCLKQNELSRVYKERNDLKYDNLKQKAEIDRLEGTIKQLQASLDSSNKRTTIAEKDELNSLRQKVSLLEINCHRLEMEQSQFIESMTKLQQEKEELQGQIDELERSSETVRKVGISGSIPDQEYMDRVYKLQVELDKTHQEVRKVQQQRDSNHRALENIKKKRMSQANLTLEIEKLARDKDGLKHLLQEKDTKLHEVSLRLSEMASESMNRNNPCIEDLSTQNRSMKIGERYRADLYGNAWCDALEALYDIGFKEDEALQIICRTLMNIYRFCLKHSHSVIQYSTECLLRASTDLNQDWTGLNPKIQTGDPRTGMRDIQELLDKMRNCLRLKACDTSLEHLVKRYCEQQHEMGGTTGSSMAALEGFITKAVELCWMMVTQNPPVFLYDAVEAGSPMDETRFKPYRKKGSNVSYLVWPALLVQEDGPVLEKGVVSIA